MTLKDGLLKARGHILFLIALITAFTIVYYLETWDTGAADKTAAIWVADPALKIPEPAPRPLTPEEQAAAVAAWAYFPANLRPETGLVDSVAGFPASTLWDSGSFLDAAIVAERLGILPPAEFDAMMSKALGSLAQLPLFAGKLPNKSFDTRTLAMTDYRNAPSEVGIGWSGLDLGRMLVPLYVLATRYPQHAEEVQRVLARWNIATSTKDGVIVGAEKTENGYDVLQEGRVGYEQYAARGFSLMGYDTGEAMRVERFLKPVTVDGIVVPTDRRAGEGYGGHAFTLSEPYVLYGLEFGWSTRIRELAWQVYLAQENRFAKTGILTAVSEDQLDQSPYFVYSTIYANETPWKVMTPNGKDASDFRLLSTKASMGWDALYQTDYTGKLVQALAGLKTAAGWQTGIFEKDGKADTAITANTNAGILLAMHFRSLGPLLHPAQPAQ